MNQNFEHKKINTLAQHYNQAYQENPNFFWEGKPDEFILGTIPLIEQGGNVLELGAGQGRNALALAQSGFHVKAIDISTVGVETMNQKAQELGLTNFQVEVQDAENALDGEFSLIVSTFMLHHFSKENAEKLITKIKKHTKIGGINALIVFTKEGNFANPSNLQEKFYPALGDMRKFYEEWEIIEYQEEEKQFTKKGQDGAIISQIIAKIIAKKIIK